jgi:hypothetical protein
MVLHSLPIDNYKLFPAGPVSVHWEIREDCNSLPDFLRLTWNSEARGYRHLAFACICLGYSLLMSLNLGGVGFSILPLPHSTR